MEQTQKEELVQALHRLSKMHSMSHTVIGLPRGEFFLLKKISHLSKELTPGQPGVKISDVSAAAEMSKPGVSQMLNSMEKKELVTRVMTKSDRRVVYVLLTKKGRATLEKAMQELNEWTNKVVSQLGPEDTAELTRLFRKLCGIIEKTNQDQ